MGKCRLREKELRRKRHRRMKRLKQRIKQMILEAQSRKYERELQQKEAPQSQEQQS
ncbi:MAG: hypothetical protein GDYSWBUE_001762 [Candidatus Fervidibacterota bacterium]